MILKVSLTISIIVSGKIFQEETNGIELIKKKDILTSLEKAIDRCEDVADVIQTIIIKNA